MKPSPPAPAKNAGFARDRERSALRRKLLPYFIGAALLVALYFGFRAGPVQVETAVAERGPLVVSVFEEGKTRIRHRHTISPPVSGFLNRVELRAGAPIQAGKTLLAVIEPASSPFLDPRARAEAEARLRATEIAKQSRQAELERANVALELAQKERARAEHLRKTQVISAQEWDLAESRVQLLERERNVAAFALRVADFEIAQARAALLQAQRPGDDGAEPLRILSPIDGYVLNVFQESARPIAAGEPIMEVGDPRDLEAEIELLSSDAVAVEVGADVSIERWGGPTPLRARVSVVERAGFTKISALGVEEQRVRVRVDFLDPMTPGRELGDRFRVEARIVTWRGEDVLQVPTGALFRRGGDWMTFVAAEGRAEARRVEITHHNGVAAEVRDGLTVGERVIVHPPDSVSEGVRVAW
jgi:HlyD family secretion protein